MDEFLLDRVKELKLIDDQLNGLQRFLVNEKIILAKRELELIRQDVADRIRKAEAAYAAF